MNQDIQSLNASEMIDKVSPEILEPYDGNLDLSTDFSTETDTVDDIGIFDTAYKEDGSYDSLQNEISVDKNLPLVEENNDGGSSFGFFIMFGVSVLLIIAFCFYFAYKDSKAQNIEDAEEDLL